MARHDARQQEAAPKARRAGDRQRPGGVPTLRQPAPPRAVVDRGKAVEGGSHVDASRSASETPSSPTAAPTTPTPTTGDGSRRRRRRRRLGAAAGARPGPDFALEWQRQWDLEEKRKEVLGRGDRITNDTLFAFRYDKEREAANGARLAQLRAAFGEFDATPITEQLRRNEPATLGRGNYTQGIETRYGARPRRVDGEASEWPRRAAHARSLREDRPRDGRSGRRGAGEPGRRHAGRAHPEQSGDADGRWIDRSFTTS